MDTMQDQRGTQDFPHQHGNAVRRLINKEEILRYLEPQRRCAATAFANLEPILFGASEWFIAEQEDAALRLGSGQALRQACLPDLPTGQAGRQAQDAAFCSWAKGHRWSSLLTLGDSTALKAIFEAFRPPQTAYITCEPHHRAILKGYYWLRGEQELVRMGVDREHFLTASEEALRPGLPTGQAGSGQAQRLTPHHIPDLNRLYREESGMLFSSRDVTEGVYYGLWQDDQLVAVAGTQLVSPTYGIAIVANVLTHPQYRNRGYATLVTSAVTKELLERCRDVVLNVEHTNAPALRAYQKLGYREDGRLVEAWGYRKEGWSLEAVFARILDWIGIR